MSFTSAQAIPYHPSQCPKCALLVDDDRCKGFVTKDPLGDMLGTFQGESEEPCSKFISAEPVEDASETDQQTDKASEVKCAQCRKSFAWFDAYKQQDTPGSLEYNPQGHGEFRPKAFCPHCGFLVAEWDIDQIEDRDRWKWYGTNESLNAGKELPPSPITFWGESIPIELQASMSDDQIDLSKIAPGVSNDGSTNAETSDEATSETEPILVGDDNDEGAEESLAGFCDLCGDSVPRLIALRGIDFSLRVSAGFNPYKTPGIDMSRNIQIARAMGAAGAFNSEEDLKEALFQNWKESALQNLTDWGLCSNCLKAMNKSFNKTGPCFIATAAFHSPFSREVNLLRLYRDTVLTKNLVGRYFIAAYYAISPFIAVIIKRSRKLQWLTRRALAPLIEYCERKLSA